RPMRSAAARADTYGGISSGAITDGSPLIGPMPFKTQIAMWALFDAYDIDSLRARNLENHGAASAAVNDVRDVAFRHAKAMCPRCRVPNELRAAAKADEPSFSSLD
ncbi:MAG: hypothetical protein VB144_13505, partial [Clostridia bacterium]|nr:hypothetical protein [Clostridia bacterium]